MLALFLNALANMIFFAHHANAFSEDDILTKIEEFSSSYSDHGSVEASAKRLPKIIADVQVLHDTKSTDKLEDTGHKLYLNIGERNFSRCR